MFETDPSLIIEQFDIADNRCGILLPISIGEKNYAFGVDTGVPGIIYGEAFRPQLGSVRASAHVATLGRPTNIELFTPLDASLGTVKLTSAGLVGCADVSRFNCGRSDGLIGMSLLMNYVVRIDPCRRKFFLLNSAGAAAGRRLKLIKTGRFYSVDIEILGHGHERFLIDTGMTDCGSVRASVVKRLVDANVALQGKSVKGFAFDGAHTFNTYRVSLGVGGFEHHGLRFTAHSGVNVSAIGLEYLRRYVVTIDFPNSVMYLRPSVHFQAADSGVALERHGEQLIVKAVEADSEGAGAGIRVGDVVVAVNETALARLDKKALRAMLLKTFLTAGSASSIGIQRGGKRLTIQLSLPAAKCPDEDCFAAGGQNGSD